MHKNAPLTPKGREVLVQHLQADQSVAKVAQAMGLPETTVRKWWRRHQPGEGLQDRSSRPHHSPRAIVTEPGGTDRSAAAPATDGTAHRAGAWCVIGDRVAGAAPRRPASLAIGIAADALEAWLSASGLKGGPIFRRVRGQTFGRGFPLPRSRRSCNDALRAGLQGDFAGHSLRFGLITEGGRQGIALPAIMAMPEHRSIASVIGHLQAGGVQDNPAAHLLDDAPASKT